MTGKAGYFCLSLLCASATCSYAEINKVTSVKKDVVFRLDGKEQTYRDIVGERFGLFRASITINGSPALFSASDSESYYTLQEEGSKVLIDCIYVDLRNSSNGLRVSRGICGLKQPLNSNYTELASQYSNVWQEEVSKLSIEPLIENKASLDFLVGKTLDFELYQQYNSIRDLENATPAYYLKYKLDCYNLDKAKVFYVYKKDLKEASGEAYLFKTERGRYFFEKIDTNSSVVEKKRACTE